MHAQATKILKIIQDQDEEMNYILVVFPCGAVQRCLI